MVKQYRYVCSVIICKLIVRIVFGSYLYYGRVVLKRDNVIPLLMLGNKYFVDNLKTSCLEHMQQFVENEPVVYLGHANTFACPELQATCLQHIMCNLDIVMSSADWLSLDIDTIVSLVKAPDVVTSCEFTVLQVQIQ